MSARNSIASLSSGSTKVETRLVNVPSRTSLCSHVSGQEGAMIPSSSSKDDDLLSSSSDEIEKVAMSTLEHMDETKSTAMLNHQLDDKKEKPNEDDRGSEKLKDTDEPKGIFFIVPCIDTYRKVDLRVLSFEVPPQEILSKDSVTVAVDAVVYFRISNATISVTNVEDAARSTKLLAQTTLRNILGTKTLAEMLSDREAISHQMQTTLDEATEPWGVKVERVEVKDVRLPVQLQRAMAAEAEAAREARAKVIVAEGEQKASRALKEAAEVIAESPSALQLRYLQTLNSISAEKNSTIIFPFPIDLLSAFLQRPAPKV
ncbi:Mechanosensory protein 2 [Trichostrongylus colubriformis]|uniref:Mechanosensory protein 2 n=1 Tax=Trichostrongylus colubriformis TaxID=6319 RepID=A0AAN8IRF2_TRICO